MRNRIVGMVLVGTLAAGGVALAGGAASRHHIVQIGKVFKLPGEDEPPAELSAKAGDVLVIENKDDVVHHLFTASPGFEVNEMQPPGTTSEITLPSAGELDLRCAIHPSMHIKVEVK